MVLTFVIFLNKKNKRNFALKRQLYFLNMQKNINQIRKLSSFSSVISSKNSSAHRSLNNLIEFDKDLKNEKLSVNASFDLHVFETSQNEHNNSNSSQSEQLESAIVGKENHLVNGVSRSLNQNDLNTKQTYVGLILDLPLSETNVKSLGSSSSSRQLASPILNNAPEKSLINSNPSSDCVQNEKTSQHNKDSKKSLSASAKSIDLNLVTDKVQVKSTRVTLNRDAKKKNETISSKNP